MKRIKNSLKNKETLKMDCYEDEIVDQNQILRSLVLSRSGGVNPDLLRQWVKSGRD
ncbi:hypothetical protein LBMAG05_09320 [Actinomycetes bacterium]|nr:hypothetical protein LBMAG05_09320 [Actinomycetes bacterium]